MDARVLTRELFLGDNADWKLPRSSATCGSAVHEQNFINRCRPYRPDYFPNKRPVISLFDESEKRILSFFLRESSDERNAR